MKVTIKKNGEVVYFQSQTDSTVTLNKLVDVLMRLPKGDKDEVVLESHGHELKFVSQELDVSVIARIANGVIVKNALDAILGIKTEKAVAPAAPAAPEAAAPETAPASI